MAIPRRCSECDTFLPKDASDRKKTCSTSCRQKRARRIARQRKVGSEKGHDAQRIPTEFKELLEAAGHDVVKEELRPVVREALTEDSMQALQRMVGLLPLVVDQLAQDIMHPDEVVRQKAHTMVLRYTLGHEKALPSDDKQPAGLTVNLTMPRPAAPDTTTGVSDTEAPVDATADELRVCDTCNLPKPVEQFFGAALRCESCAEAFQARANALLEPPKPATGEEDG